MATMSATETMPEKKEKKQDPLPVGTIRKLFVDVLDHAVPAGLGVLAAWASIFALGEWQAPSAGGIAFLYDALIPGGAGLALFVAIVLAVKQAVQQHVSPQFGRKGLLSCAMSVTLCLSCFYRAIFTASEGAALCRGTPSAFNAPFAGRSIATFGEIAFAVQVGYYISQTATRLQIKGFVWSHHALVVWVPVCLAEALSWSGVLSGNAQWFCIECVTPPSLAWISPRTGTPLLLTYCAPCKVLDLVLHRNGVGLGHCRVPQQEQTLGGPRHAQRAARAQPRAVQLQHVLRNSPFLQELQPRSCGNGG